MDSKFSFVKICRNLEAQKVQNEELILEIKRNFPVDMQDDLLERLARVNADLDAAILYCRENDVPKKSEAEENMNRRGWKPRKSHRIRKSESGIAKIIAGQFDGEHFISNDGIGYDIPVNDLLHLKLLPGDQIELRIMKDGSSTFSLENAVARKKLVGVLVFNQEKQIYLVESDGQTWNVLPSIVSAHNGRHGDDVTFSVSTEHNQQWASIEQVIPYSPDHDDNYKDFVAEQIKSNATPEVKHAPMSVDVTLLQEREADPLPQIEEMPIIKESAIEKIELQDEADISDKVYEQDDDVTQEVDLEIDQDFDLFAGDLEDPQLPRELQEGLEKLFYDGIVRIDEELKEISVEDEV